MRLISNAFGLLPVVGLLLLASPAFADEPTVPPKDRAAYCKENPGKCEEARAKHDAFCKENPEKCEQMNQKHAERQAYCKQHPEKCEQQRARMKQHHDEMQAKCAADPAKCEELKKAQRERQKHVGGHAPMEKSDTPDSPPK